MFRCNFYLIYDSFLSLSLSLVAIMSATIETTVVAVPAKRNQTDQKRTDETLDQKMDPAAEKKASDETMDKKTDKKTDKAKTKAADKLKDDGTEKTQETEDTDFQMAKKLVATNKATLDKLIASQEKKLKIAKKNFDLSVQNLLAFNFQSKTDASSAEPRSSSSSSSSNSASSSSAASNSASSSSSSKVLTQIGAEVNEYMLTVGGGKATKFATKSDKKRPVGRPPKEKTKTKEDTKGDPSKDDDMKAGQKRKRGRPPYTPEQKQAAQKAKELKLQNQMKSGGNKKEAVETLLLMSGEIQASASSASTAAVKAEENIEGTEEPKVKKIKA